MAVPAHIRASQAAALHGVTTRRIQYLAAQGRIRGATLNPDGWHIPAAFTVTAPPKRARRLAKIKT